MDNPSDDDVLNQYLDQVEDLETSPAVDDVNFEKVKQVNWETNSVHYSKLLEDYVNNTGKSLEQKHKQRASILKFLYIILCVSLAVYAIAVFFIFYNKDSTSSLIIELLGSAVSILFPIYAIVQVIVTPI